MTFPRISIVTPSFNQGKYLDETMRSVLDQGYPNLEYIVIDGGSSDESVEIIKRYAGRLAYWVSEKDKGQTDALNKGIARCTGEIFGYINSDDLLMPGSLERVAQAWRDDKAQWIVGWSKYLEMDGGDYPYVVRPIGRKIDWFLHNPIPQQSSFWATRFFREIGPFRTDMHYCFDYEYWMRLRFAANVRPLGVRKCLSAFRLHEESKTVALQDRFAADLELVRNEYKKHLTRFQRLAWWWAKRGEDAERTRDRAWSALNRKDIKSARRQALTAMGEQPLSAQSWKLLICSLRGH
jgi:glycosyltransferase involved in cell wall biosynthesis